MKNNNMIEGIITIVFIVIITNLLFFMKIPTGYHEKKNDGTYDVVKESLFNTIKRNF